MKIKSVKIAVVQVLGDNTDVAGNYVYVKDKLISCDMETAELLSYNLPTDALNVVDLESIMPKTTEGFK